MVQWWVDPSTDEVEVALAYGSCPAGSEIPSSIVTRAQHFFDEHYGPDQIFVTDVSAAKPQAQGQ